MLPIVGTVGVVTANFKFLFKLDLMFEAEDRINTIKLHKLYQIDLQKDYVLLKQVLKYHGNKISVSQLNFEGSIAI